MPTRSRQNAELLDVHATEEQLELLRALGLPGPNGILAKPVLLDPPGVTAERSGGLSVSVSGAPRALLLGAAAVSLAGCVEAARSLAKEIDRAEGSAQVEGHRRSFASAYQRCDRGSALDCLGVWTACDSREVRGRAILEGHGVNGPAGFVGDQGKVCHEPARDALLSRACELGLADACDRWHLLLRKRPNGTDRSPVPVFQIGCEHGSASVCRLLGDVLFDEDWSSRDRLARARAAYDRGCRSGDAVSCGRIARLVAIDPALDRTGPGPLALHRDACDRGAPESCVALAAFEHDRTAAEALLRRACTLGDHGACITVAERGRPGSSIVTGVRRVTLPLALEHPEWVGFDASGALHIASPHVVATFDAGDGLLRAEPIEAPGEIYAFSAMAGVALVRLSTPYRWVLWSPSDPRAQTALDGENWRFGVKLAGFSRDGRRLVVFADNPARLEAREVPSGRLVGTRPIPAPEPVGPVYAPHGAWVPRGYHHQHEAPDQWDPHLVHAPDGLQEFPEVAELDGDDRRLALALREGIALFDTTSGARLAGPFAPPFEWPWAFAFRPDGRMLVLVTQRLREDLPPGDGLYLVDLSQP